METTIRVAVIGCGGIARHHLPAYREIEGMEVVAAVDVRPEAAGSLAADFGIGRTFTDTGAMLETVRPDVAVVLVPYPAHCRVVEQVAAAGVHVLCQKPMAGSMAEVDRMIAACRSAGVMLGVNENYRYLKPFVMAKQAIEAGAIGELLLLHYQEVLYWRGLPRMYAELDPFFCIEMGPHYFDSIRWLTGRRARRVFGVVRRLPTLASAGDNSYYVTVEMDGGIVARIDDTVAVPGRDVRDRVYIDGTKGSIAIYAPEGEFALYDAESDAWTATALGDRNAYWIESFRGPLVDFLAALRAGRDAPLPGSDYRHVMEMVFAAYERREVELPAG